MPLSLSATEPSRGARRAGVRRGALVAVLASACVLVTALTGAAPASEVRADNWTVIGHRGFPDSRRTENTIASFAAAERAGATAVELDLQLTADGRMLVMHDSTLDRTTDCHGSVGAARLKHIVARCHGRLAGEPIPTAAQLLSWAQTHDMNVILELKTAPADRWTVRRLAVLDRMIRARGMLGQVVIMSYDAGYLANAEVADPALETDWITLQWPGVQAAAETADIVNVYSSELTAERVDQLHAAGVRVFGRMTDSPATWQHLDEVGVDGLLTDLTAAYVAWRQSH